MKVVVYLHHPAQFHLFKHVITRLQHRGHQVTVFATKKDVLEDLLREAGIAYRNFVPQGRKDNKVATAISILKQDFGLFRHCISNRPDLMIGTSAEIAHVGFILGIPNIFVNEDDVTVVPLVGTIIHPFARHLLAPDVCNTGAPAKTITYPGYHELAYLHPDLFVADRTVASRYVDVNKPYFLLRFAKLTAHHDTGIRGIDARIASKLVELLKPHGNIYITAERILEPEFESFRMPIRSADMHHVLAFSDLYIGDSQTMAAEAGCLGIPFIRCNDFVGRISYLRDLEDHYKLGFGIRPGDELQIYTTLSTLVNNPGRKEEWQIKRNRMLQDKIEVTTFIVNLIEGYPASLKVK
jgi:predicted glycosyltransferase